MTDYRSAEAKFARAVDLLENLEAEGLPGPRREPRHPMREGAPVRPYFQPRLVSGGLWLGSTYPELRSPEGEARPAKGKSAGEASPTSRTGSGHHQTSPMAVGGRKPIRVPSDDDDTITSSPSRSSDAVIRRESLWRNDS